MDTISKLKDILGLEKPVDFKTFVQSKDYCDNMSLYDFWIDKGMSMSPSISELILDGSLGNGKSYMSAYYLAYRVYLLFQQGNPQIQLGLAEDTDIYILYFSVSMTMAKKSGYNYIYEIFASCKWFQKYAPIDLELKSSIKFIGKHFYINYASSEGHQIGLNVWGFILDEANFKSGVGLGTEEQYVAVTQLYDQLLDRQASRYSRPDGTTNGLAILISSASYQSSFVEKRKSLVRNDKNVCCITSTAYETKPHMFSKETFDVFIGAGSVEPCIITSEDQRLKVLNHAKVLGTGEESKFIKHVPINLRSSFDRNIVLALQNHCGVPTNLSSSFMSNLRYLYNSYVDESAIPPILQSFNLEASTADDTELIEYLIQDNIQFPERPHSIFIDASVQHDTASVVCFRYDGKNSENNDIHTKVFSLKIVPPHFPHQTKLSKIKQFVIDLSPYINIVAVGSDNYQSINMRQDICSELALDDIRISIDSSDIPHLLWQTALVEGRIKQVKEPLLEKEVTEAVHDWKRHRVLKSQGSSDDCLQGNVGAFYLSDTIGKQQGTIDNLYNGSNHINLIGDRAMRKFLIKSGYQYNG